MDESDFNRLIRRYELGLLFGDERRKVEEWFESAGTNNYYLWTTDNKSNLRSKIRQQIDSRDHKKSSIITGGFSNSLRIPVSMRIFRTSTLNTVRHLRSGIWLRVAAAVLLLMIFAYYASWRVTDPHEVMLASHGISGKIRKVILHDESIVWLKGDSKIIYPAEFSKSERRVILEGEALFEVAKDSIHPFSVECGSIKARVLGTSFNIKTNKNDVEVIVLTGKVSLTSSGNQHSIVLLPNETAYYDNLHKWFVKDESKIELEERAALVAGTEYDMFFDDATIEYIFKKIEGKFNVIIDVTNEKINECTISANFTDQSLVRTLDLAKDAIGFNYKIENNRVTIYGSGCK